MAPPTIAPMLAVSGRPVGDLTGWVAETKLDGWRAQVAVDSAFPDGVRVTTRTGRNITGQLPELRQLADIGCPAVLDGELIAAAGRCQDFYAITSRLSARTNRPALTFVAFDLVWLDGHDLTALPYDRRRSLLLEFELPAPAVVVSTYEAADIDLLLDACEQLGVEGLMLKRLDGRYTPGNRSESWRKVKCEHWRAHAERRRVR